MINFICTAGGIGRIPKAPGTWGSLLACLLAWPIHFYGGAVALLAAGVLVTLIGIWAADRYQAATGRHDAPEVVIDEVAGQWLTLAACPLTPLWILAGFAVFRFFDIVKPWPVCWADRKLPGGFGVMADDVLAAVYAALAFFLAQRLLEG
jgi:phosphatidylglycerophosphatase A